MMGCRSLSVRYSNGDWGIRDVTVDFAPGESTAVVGASGSGKSSLLNALLGLAPIVGGTVTFGLDRVDNLSSDAYATLRRRRFGVIFQQGLLLEELNVVDNAGLPLRLLGRSAKHARATAHGLLERLGLAEHALKMPWQLSGGQRQRVAVARAVVHQPAVILADEPTGALDRSTALSTMRLLLDEGRLRSSTVIVVTHDDLLANLCDKRLRTVDGSLAAGHD